ncbi:MAG: cell division protein FtsQ [Gaiellales bacterium]|nr:cell division protein FtsQ [Gaiellales bacterium]
MGGRRRRGGGETGRVQPVFLRRRAAAVLAAAVVCAAAAGAVELGYLWLKGSGTFQLRSVAVRGGSESDRLAVRDAVARAAAGRSLLALSPARVAGAIEHVPTIRLATVDRDFPHTLRIHIVPERPVALAVGPGGYRSLVAASGRVLRVFQPGEAVPVLPHVWTQRERPIPGGSMRAADAQAALETLAARPSDFSAHVANVKVDPERGLVMRLRGGLDIVLGPPLQLTEKLRAAAWVLRRYSTSAERAQLVYADVTAPERPAVMPRGGYAATAGLGEKTKKTHNGSQTAQNGA